MSNESSGIITFTHYNPMHGDMGSVPCKLDKEHECEIILHHTSSTVSMRIGEQLIIIDEGEYLALVKCIDVLNSK